MSRNIKILQNHISIINKIILSSNVLKSLRLKKHVEILESKVRVLRELQK